MTPRRGSDTMWRLRELGVLERIEIAYGDVTDMGSVLGVLARYRPDEIYNLAAQSFVGASWDQPVHTADVNAIGTVNLLEGIRLTSPTGAVLPSVDERDVWQGAVAHAERNDAVLSPQSVRRRQAVRALDNRQLSRKLRSARVVRNPVQSRITVAGIEFVTRKVTDGVARIKLGLATEISLGNLDAQRDWGYAADYVEAMWRMLQQPSPDDYVIATGVSTTIRDMCELAFTHVEPRLGTARRDRSGTVQACRS